MVTVWIVELVEGTDWPEDKLDRSIESFRLTAA